MSRLLGEARVAVLPDGTRFKPDAEAQIKKATAGLSASIRMKADTKELDAQLAELKARSEAFSKSLGNLKIKDDSGIIQAMAKQASNLKGELDKVGDSSGITRAASQLDKMISVTDKVRAALGKTTFAQEEVGRAAAAAADKSAEAGDKMTRAAEATAKAQQASLDRIAKARAADMEAEAKRVAATRDMYRKLFQEMDRRDGIKIGIDEAYSDAQMAKFRAKIDALTRKANIRLGLDSKRAVGEALSLREKLRAALSDIKAKVHIDRSSTGGVLSFLRGKFLKDIENTGGDAGAGFGKGFIGGLSKSAIFQNPGITALVVAGLAALPAAVGAVGVLGGIALGAGLIFGAEKLIKSQTKNLTQQIKQIQTAMGGQPASATTIANQKLSIQNTQATIQRLESAKKLTAAQQQQLSIAKQRLVIEQQTLAASQGKGQGTAAQRAQIAQAQQQLAQYQKYQAAFQKLNGAVTNAKFAFLQFAIIATKPLIKPFTDAVNYLASQMKGPLAKSFHDFFTAVGPLVKPVVTSLLEIVKGILPGMAFLLEKARAPLSKMFIDFGKIVGLRLGDWFRAAAPYIKDSAHYFNALINAVGTVGTYLVRFGGESAKAFSDPALKGFGPIIKAIANDLLRLVVPAFQGWAEILAPVTKLLGLILVPVLNFLTRNPALVKALSSWAAAFFLLSKALIVVNLALKIFDVELVLSNPAIAVIAAIAVGALLIIKHWKPIAGFFVEVWKHIWSGFIGPFINFFTQTIPHAFSVTIGWLKKNWPLLLGILGGPFAAAAVLIIKYHNQIFNAVKNAWGHIENVITGAVKPIVSVINGVMHEVYKIFVDVWHAIWAGIKPIILIIVGLIGEAWIGIKNLTGLVWPWIFHTVKDAWGHIENATTGIVKPMVSWIKGAWNEVKNATAGAWNWLFKTIKDGWGHIENATTGIVKPMVNWIRGAWDTLKNATAAAWDWIFNTSKSIWGHIENAVTGIVKPMVSGIRHAWDNLKTWTADAFNWIHDHIVSPLQKAWDWISNHLVRGIESAFRGLISTVKSIWSGLKAAVEKPINVVIDIWNKFAGFVDKGLSVFGVHNGLNDHVGHINLATGGGVPGYAPGSDTVPAMLSPGEYILNPTAARAIGHKNLDAINAAARPGGGQHMIRDAAQQFAGGGTVNLSGYINPLRGVRGLLPERVDQGVDFSGNGPVGALGDATILETNGRGWPGGPYMSYRLNNGSLAGLAVYLAENIHPTVRPGQDVRAGQTIANMFTGGTGIEMGFADSSGRSPLSQTAAAGSISGANLPQGGTLVGKAFDQLLIGLGVRPAPNLLGPSGNSKLPGGIPGGKKTGGFSLWGALASLAKGALGALGTVLKPLAQLALTGVEDLLSGALNHIPGKGPFHDLPIAVLRKLFDAAKARITGNGNNYTGGAGSAYTGPAHFGGGFESLSALTAYARYFMQNGLSAAAAAGMAGTISGEQDSRGPESVGSGGFGLIGWTGNTLGLPAGYHGPTGNVARDLAIQLRGVIGYMNANGGAGPLNAAGRSGGPVAAGNLWSSKYERPAVHLSDTRPATAVAIYNMLTAGNTGTSNRGQATITAHTAKHASGGLVKGFASGGSVTPTGLARAQSAEVDSFRNLSGATKALLAHPNAYARRHKAALTSELRTLTRRQTAEQAAYQQTLGKGFTRSHLLKLGDRAHSEWLTDHDKVLSTAEVKQTGALGGTLKTLISDAFGTIPPTPTGSGLPSAAVLAKEQTAEKAAYTSLVNATKNALAHPDAFVKTHKKTLTGELATLIKKQEAEQAVYDLLSGKGLTKRNYAKFTGKVRSELTTDKDKYLDATEAVLTAKLADTLDTILGVKGPKVPTVPTGKHPHPVPRTSIVALARNQAAENTAFDNLLATTRLIGLPLRGPLGTLSTREAALESAYWPLSGKNGLSGKNLSHYTAELASVLHAVQDKRITRMVPGAAGALARTLHTLEAIIAGGPAAIAGSPTIGKTGHPKHGIRSFAAGGIIPEHVVGIGLSSGIPYQFGERGPERVVPHGQNATVTLEIVGGGDSDFDAFMLTLIRRYVRVKGGGNVQRAFGRH